MGGVLSKACHCRRWFQIVLLLGAIVTLFPYSLFRTRQQPAAPPASQMQMQQRSRSPEQNPSRNPSRLRTPEEAERWVPRLVAYGVAGCSSWHYCCPAASLHTVIALARLAALLMLTKPFSLTMCPLQND